MMQFLYLVKYTAQLFINLPLHSVIFKLRELFPGRAVKQKLDKTLPTELLFMIFGHLSQTDLFSALLVSKHWSTIAVMYLFDSPTPRSIHAFGSLFTLLGENEMTAFKYLDFLSSIDLQFAHLPSLIRKLAKLLESVELSRINLSNQANMEDRIVIQLLTRSTRIQSICLNATGVRTLNFLSSNLDYLRTLELSKCVHVTNNGLRNIGLNCKNLVSLNLSGSFIDDATLMFISESCLKLKMLDLSDCFHITEQSFISLFLKPCADLHTLAIPVLIVTLNSLEIISNANNCPFPLQSVAFTANTFHPNKDDALSLFVSIFNRIECISFIHCNITNAIFDAIAFKCTRLRELKIDYEPTATHTQTQMYASNFRRGSLDQLCTKRVFVDGEEIITESGIKLSRLCLPFCHLPLRPISNLARILSSSLCRLNVASCGSIIDDTQIRCIVDTCPLLSSVDLSFCHALTDACVESIVLLRFLNTINLSLTNSGLHALLSGRPSLTDLIVVVDPQNASIARIWDELNLNRYFGPIPLGDSFAQIVNRDNIIRVAINAINAEDQDLDDEMDKPALKCTLSPIDVLQLQHQFSSVFIHMQIVQNPGGFQYSYVKWRRLQDDFSGRKLLLSDIFFRSNLSFQKKCRGEKSDKKESNIEWRCVMCVVVCMKIRGWCPGLLGSVASLLIE